MSDAIKAMEALRDAAQLEKDFQGTLNTDASNTLWLAACQTISSCNRALAALRAEEPKACAGWQCAGATDGAVCSGKSARCRCACGLPYSAHKQPASDPERVVLETPGWHKQPALAAPLGHRDNPASRLVPAPTAVPEMPSHDYHLGCVWVAEADCGRIHAACVTIAQERDDYWARLEACEAELSHVTEMLSDAAAECSRARAQLAEAQAALKAARAEELEPDAVWTLEVLPGSGVRRLLFNDNHPVAINPALVNTLLAGRERVRLRVYVVEESK